MRAAEIIAIRIAEAERCMEAIEDSDLPRQLLAARRAGLYDALAEIESAEAEEDAAEDTAETLPAEGVSSPLDDRAAPSDPPAESGHSTAGVVWTEARKALLREAYPAGEPVGVIFARINALPGPPCASHQAVAATAATMGLRRPPRGTPTPPDPFAGIPADDVEEARAMIRNGNAGAKALAEYFGWDMERAQAVAAAIRHEKAAAA
jgi:hypothetical protein